MTLTDGWLERQATKAKEEIQAWSPTKREVMLRESESAGGSEGAAKTPIWKCD